MSSPLDSLTHILETQKFLNFGLSDEFNGSITRMNKQIGNIGKAFDSVLLLQNQSRFVEMASQISEQMPKPLKVIRDFGDFSAVTNTLMKFSKEMNTSYQEMFKVLQLYDFDKLSKIIQGTLKICDDGSLFDVNEITEQIAETYIADEETGLTEKNRNSNVDAGKEYINNIRDWISFCITIISFLLTIYSLVSTKPSNTYNTNIEINNYYVNDLEISADLLNAMSYRIIVKDNVMPRIKSDCSSRVIGHLNTGQAVTVSEKYKKWVNISWEDENGNCCSGWVQKYKVAKFK